MTLAQGDLLVYEDDSGKAVVDVRLQDDSVWLTQALIAELFQTTVPNISTHIRNIYAEGELQPEATVKKFLTVRREGHREVRREMEHYSLDMIISVGYRVKSSLATRFRIWATSILRDHLVKGYTMNRQRLAEKGLEEARQTLALLANTLDTQDLINDEGRTVLDIVNNYARTWRLLWQYDEDSLPGVGKVDQPSEVLSLESVRQAIASLKAELSARGETTKIFGQERGNGLKGILGAISQTFGGEDLYRSVEEKAANLLYFLIKDHPFVDGNKRIGSFLFLLFLRENKQKLFLDNRAMVALTLLTAASDPAQKNLLVRLIINLLQGQ